MAAAGWITCQIMDGTGDGERTRYSSTRAGRRRREERERRKEKTRGIHKRDMWSIPLASEIMVVVIGHV